MQNKTLSVRFKRKEDSGVGNRTGLGDKSSKLHEGALVSSSLVQWGCQDGRPEGRGGGEVCLVPANIVWMTKTQAWFPLPDMEHLSSLPHEQRVKKGLLFHFRRSPNKAAALTMPEGGDHFVPTLGQTKSSVRCVCSWVPLITLCREWSAGGVKEVSGGLTTARVESKKKVEGSLWNVYWGFTPLCTSVDQPFKTSSGSKLLLRFQPSQGEVRKYMVLQTGQNGRKIAGSAKSKLWPNLQHPSCPAMPKAQPGATKDPRCNSAAGVKVGVGREVVSKWDLFKLHTFFSLILRCTPATPP